MRDKLIEQAIERAKQEQPELIGTTISKPNIKERLKHPRTLFEQGRRIMLANNVEPEDLPNLHEHYVYEGGCFRDRAPQQDRTSPTQRASSWQGASRPTARTNSIGDLFRIQSGQIRLNPYRVGMIRRKFGEAE
jgi:hypothetical protein